MTVRRIAAGLVLLALAACAHEASSPPVDPASSPVRDQASSPVKGMDLYLVRHAETVANATKDYSHANQRTFSPRGRREIDALDAKLAAYRFDHVLVSPTWRTRHTIAPWLAHTGRVAEIWPELAECCYQADRDTPASAALERGHAIDVEEELQALFTFRGDDARRWIEAKTWADSRLQVDEAIRLLRERYAGTGDAVLVVGHFKASARIVAALLGAPELEPEVALKNAEVTHLRQAEDGRFRIVAINGRPFDGSYW